MAKLVARNGEIQAVQKWESGLVNVVFTRRAINPVGDLGRITLTVGGDKVDLTFAQGISLANEILRRCQG